MPILIDGGMGEELRARGLNTDAKVAGLALLESPDVVREVHQEFIDAGAEVITTWNYALTQHRLRQSEMADNLGVMTSKSVEMANEARSNSGKSAVRVAGCLPPLRASYEPNEQEFISMREDYAEIAGYLAPGVDLFICETMASAKEAAAAADAAAVYGKPVWVSWTLRDECDGLLRSGETVDDALSALDSASVEAVLFNCCDVAAIDNSMPYLRARTTRLIGAYANSFTPIDKDWKRQGDRFRDLRELTPEDYAHLVGQWCANGADIVGGCCGISPAHISHLRKLIDGGLLVSISESDNHH